jgi:hypothetical protein
MNGKFLIMLPSLPFALSISTRRPFVLSFVEGNGLLLSTGSVEGQPGFFQQELNQKNLSQSRLKTLDWSMSLSEIKMNFPRALSPSVMVISPSLSPFLRGAQTGLFI